jgi:hypothetical protein
VAIKTPQAVSGLAQDATGRQAGGMNHGRKTSPHIDGGETTGVNPTGSPRLLDNEGSVLPRGLSHLIDGL